jgi:two-component system CheB/CheR fusion protein
MMAVLSSPSGLRNHPELARVLDIVRTVARNLIGADGVTVVVRDGNDCVYIEEDAIGPLWKGQRFPIGQCVSGWVITHNSAAVIPDIHADDRVLQAAYRPTFVRSMAMVPVGNPPIAAIGAYWASAHTATDSQMDILAAIGDSALIQTEE